MNYFNHYKMEVEGTYIISIPGNKLSHQLTQQCLDSCEKVGQPNIRIFPAFDATDSPIEQQDYDLGQPIGELGSIKVPEMLKDCLLYTSPSPRDRTRSRMPSSA